MSRQVLLWILLIKLSVGHYIVNEVTMGFHNINDFSDTKPVWEFQFDDFFIEFDLLEQQIFVWKLSLYEQSRYWHYLSHYFNVWLIFCKVQTVVSKASRLSLLSTYQKWPLIKHFIKQSLVTTTLKNKNFENIVETGESAKNKYFPQCFYLLP